MGTGFMIRRAVFTDVPALRLAFSRMLKETDAGGPGYPVHDGRALDTFTVVCAHRLEHDPGLLAYVALDDATGELLGFLGGEIAERVIGEPRRFGAAHWLYVEPHARGRGVARALVREAIPDLLAAGVTAVELAARYGDSQWQQRGWYPFLVHYVLPLEAVAAAAVERPAAPPPAPEPELEPVAEEPAPVELPPVEERPPAEERPPVAAAPAPAPEPEPEAVAVAARMNGAAVVVRRRRRPRRPPEAAPCS